MVEGHEEKLVDEVHKIKYNQETEKIESKTVS